MSSATRTKISPNAGSNFPLVGYFEGTLDDLHLGSERNQVRLPTYARLDIRANRTFTFDRRRLTLFLEIVNAIREPTPPASTAVRVPSGPARREATGASTSEHTTTAQYANLAA